MEVETILTMATYSEVVWAGDMNWDMQRNSAFSRAMKDFVQRMGLLSLWSLHPIDFSHIHTDNKSVSTVDHFFISPGLVPLVSDCGVIHRGDNLSRHSPIWLRLDLGCPLPVRKDKPVRTPKKPSWPKSTTEDVENYTASLQAKLQSMAIPGSLNCNDPQCSDLSHSQERDSLTLDILLAVVETTHTCLPFSGGRRVGGEGRGHAEPGWNEEVEPFRQEARYWYRVWLKEGRPNNGWLHATMSRKRTQYHYAVRRLRKKSDKIKAEKLFVASMEGDINLLNEMKKIRCGVDSSTELPDTVDGANGQEEIVDKFRTVYSSLYNSAGTQEEMANLHEKVSQLIRVDSVIEVNKVTGLKVKEAVSLMKPMKGDISGGFTSDALINAPDILFENLASVFRSWLLHGTVSLSLLACAFLPLLKSSLKDPADPGSYRAIAGSSLLLKLFEKVVLLIWGPLLAADSLQFGYKPGTFATQCSWLLQENIGHYLSSGSQPHC